MGKFKENSKVKDFFEDMEKYELSFECNECGALDEEHFIYDRTVANGEVWICKICGTELLTPVKPNEDNY